MDNNNGREADSSSVNLTISYMLKALSGAIASVIVVYSVLSYLLIPFAISFPAGILLGIMIFGLTISQKLYRSNENSVTRYTRGNTLLIFAIVYVLMLTTVFFSYTPIQLQISWEQLTLIHFATFVSAASLIFFLPGFAITLMLDRKGQLSWLAKFLIGFVFSITITGIASNVIAASGLPLKEGAIIIKIIFALILGSFVFTHRARLVTIDRNIFAPERLRETLILQSGQLLVFASLSALAIFSSAYLYDGAIIGDQLFHHGRALEFLSGSYRELATSGIDENYPTFFHALLAAVFAFSSVPSINSYVMLSFLNIMPAFGFYYFVSRWLPKRNAAIFATMLFVLSSGFGWIHVLNLAGNADLTSIGDVLEILENGGKRTFDIRLPNNFLNTGTLTIPLTILALPIGFILLGLLKEKSINNILYFILLFVVTTAGVLAHDEFYLFILTAFVISLIFKSTVNQRQNIIYPAIIAALISVVLFNVYLPGDPYGSRPFFDVPLVVVALPFGLIAWILSILSNKISYRTKEQTQSKYKGLNRNVLNAAIICSLAYLYIFTFIVWNEIPTQNVHAQVIEDGAQIVPWYLYPMRFGVTGLLGLAFLVSFVFKRFQKEIYIFIIISLIAILTGPYYNEYRLHKYVMMSLAALASLLIVDLLKRKHLAKPVVSSMLIGLIITSSGLSIAMYFGYIALSLEKPDFQMFMHHRYASTSIDTLDFIRQNTDPSTDNVAIPNDYIYHFRRHQPNAFLAEEIESFTGIPFANKLTQSSALLQSSTLEGFYNLADYSKTKYVIIPKNYASKDLSELNQFLLEHFPIHYEDNNNIVLYVPPVSSTSSDFSSALILPQEILQNKEPAPIDYRGFKHSSILYYQDNNYPDLNIPSTTITESATAVIQSEERQETLWSSNLTGENIDFIEVKFRVLNENQLENHAGITWEIGDRSYYLFMRSQSLSLYSTVDKEFAKDQTVRRELEVWHTLQVIHDKSGLYVYLDGDLRMQFPKQVPSDDTITRVGIRSLNNAAEFEPVIIGELHDVSTSTATFDKHYNYYYPISALALSRLKYDTFVDGDFSAFSQKNVILSFDPIQIEKYLAFAEKGGVVAVINTNSDFAGGFSRLFGMTQTEIKEFNAVALEGGSVIKINGTTTDIEISAPESVIKSYYLYDNEAVAPFAIEKMHGKGKIIYFNALAYFQAVSKSPQDFMTLKDFPGLMNMNMNITASELSPDIVIGPPPRLAGPLDISGEVEINSSTIYFPADNPLYTSRISILSNNISMPSSTNVQNEFHNSIVTGLLIHGPFTVTLSSSGANYYPLLSDNGYIPFLMQSSFDMSISLSNESTAEFTVGEKTDIEVTGGKIQLLNIVAAPVIKPVLILFKHPQVEIIGETRFNELYSRNPSDLQEWLANGNDLAVTGTVEFTIHNIEQFSDGKESKHVTYLQWIKIDQPTGSTTQGIRLPGDTSPFSKERNITIPIEDAFRSGTNVALLSSLAILFIILLYRRSSLSIIRLGIKRRK